jgi:DNA-binding transcriptional ArsR family regulator
MDQEPYVLSNVEQVRVLASPIRSAIMQTLCQGGERSVAELAESVGASGPATQYHVRMLLDVGLILFAGKRRAGQRSESVYRAVSDRITIPTKSDSPEFMQALLELALTTIRNLEKEVAQAYSFAPSEGTDQRPVRILGRTGRLHPDLLPKLQGLLSEAVNLLEPSDSNPSHPLYTIRTFVIKKGG